MSWVKVDDKAWAHPKFLGLSGEAVRLWLFALCWSGSQGTDGEIPSVLLRPLGSEPQDAEELVRAGLWIPNDNGWSIHGYLEFQPSAAEQKAKREARAEAGRRGGQRSWDSRVAAKSHQPEAKAEASAEANAEAFADGLLTTCHKQNRTPNPNPNPNPNPDGTPRGTPPQVSAHPPTVPDTLSQPEQAPAPKPSKNAGKRSVKGWEPDASMAELAQSLGLDCSVEAEKMRDWALSGDRRKADWNATFRNWMRRSATDARLPARGGASYAVSGGGGGRGSLTRVGRVTEPSESMAERAARYAREMEEDGITMWEAVSEPA